MKDYNSWLNENKIIAHKEEINEKFVEKRKAGAADIASKAASKGGYSKLTAWHFSAKLAPYQEAYKAVEEGKPVSFFEKKYKDAMSRLHSLGMQNQKTFQELIGILEVWGEVLLQVKNAKTY